MPTKATPKRRGVIYGRQSKTKDGSGSITDQTTACRKAAKTFGIDVVAEIIEPPSTSAYKNRGRNRPRFPEILEMVSAGAVEVVIVYKTDRLSRGGGPGWAPLWDAADESDLELDLDRFVLTPDGYKSEFELGIRATMDREESKKTSDRIIDMKERHAAEGRPSGGGRRPYGYAADKLTIVEAEAEVLREIVARYLAGEGTRALCRWLNDAGHKSALGVEWQVGTLNNLLANPRMAGLRVYKGEIVGEATWPAIIDRPTWDRLAARVASRARGPGQSKTSKYLLQQVLRCSRCGEKMNGAPTAGKPRYRCQKRPGTASCGGVSINAEPLDELIVKMVLYRLDSPAVKDALAGRTAPPDAGVNAASEAILANERRLEEAREMFALGEIDRKDLVAIRRTVEAELDKLRRTLVRTEQAITLAKFVDEGQDLGAMWDDLPQGRKQQILRALIDRVVISPALRGRTRFDPDRAEVIWRA